MRGFVPTPEPVVDLMVDKLFRGRTVTATTRVLDPGCGPGAFVSGIIRWVRKMGSPMPSVLGVDLDPRHVAEARARFSSFPTVRIESADFLRERFEEFDFVIGNPPYVPITSLDPAEREAYRLEFETARGRFDLYLLFFEQSLRALKEDGRLVFITPEKFVYVETARPLRSLMSRRGVSELHFLDEATFPGLVTYPMVSTLNRMTEGSRTQVVRRDHTRASVALPPDGTSWQPAIVGTTLTSSGLTLSSVASRISCGVATGADGVFVIENAAVPPELRKYAFPTVAGRSLTVEATENPEFRMLVPYRKDGSLIPESELGAFRKYLSRPERRDTLEGRTCVLRKPWYAFHETPQLRSMLRPKILCRDICDVPRFIPDRGGRIVPRHSVYYITPRVGVDFDGLLRYLNSADARGWLLSHCQRAANGYLRLQSTVLKRLPVPDLLAPVVLKSSFPSRRSA